VRDSSRVNLVLALALAAGVTAILLILNIIPMWLAGVALFFEFMVASTVQAVRYNPKQKKRKWG
jgi:hypothetical protein